MESRGFNPPVKAEENLFNQHNSSDQHNSQHHHQHNYPHNYPHNQQYGQQHYQSHYEDNYFDPFIHGNYHDPLLDGIWAWLLHSLHSLHFFSSFLPLFFFFKNFIYSLFSLILTFLLSFVLLLLSCFSSFFFGWHCKRSQEHNFPSLAFHLQSQAPSQNPTIFTSPPASSRTPYGRPPRKTPLPTPPPPPPPRPPPNPPPRDRTPQNLWIWWTGIARRHPAGFLLLRHIITLRGLSPRASLITPPFRRRRILPSPPPWQKHCPPAPRWPCRVPLPSLLLLRNRNRNLPPRLGSVSLFHVICLWLTFLFQD